MTPLNLTVDILAAYRIVHLIQIDRLPGWTTLRARIIDNADTHPTRRNLLAELITCPWCLSVWTAAAVIPAATTTIGHTAALILAASAAAALLTEHTQ